MERLRAWLRYWANARLTSLEIEQVATLLAKTSPHRHFDRRSLSNFQHSSKANLSGLWLSVGATLVKGPLRGRPAYSRVPRKASVPVPHVRAFPEHIACDTTSEAEAVAPLIKKRRILGVLDLDSQRVARFDVDDQNGCDAVGRRSLSMWVETRILASGSLAGSVEKKEKPC